MLKKIKKLPPKILIVTSYKKKFFRNFIDKKRVNYQIKDPKNIKRFSIFKKFRQKKDFLISFASGFIFKKNFCQILKHVLIFTRQHLTTEEEIHTILPVITKKKNLEALYI